MLFPYQNWRLELIAKKGQNVWIDFEEEHNLQAATLCSIHDKTIFVDLAKMLYFSCLHPI